MRGTTGSPRTNFNRVLNWRVLTILAAFAIGTAALLTGGPRGRTAHAQQQPTPTSPPAGAWTKCADEGSACSFGGTKRVRYGANDTYNYGIFNNSVQCGNSVFGDPVPGTGKECYYQDPPAPPTPPALPDYSQVDDVLNGKRNLLRDDDFVIGFTAAGLSEVLSGSTDDSKATLNALDSYPNAEFGGAEFAAGRFFNAGHDFVMQLGEGGVLYAASLLERQSDSGLGYLDTNQSFSNLPIIPGPGYQFVSAVADFNGDGYDDIALGYDQPGRMRIMTAQDVNNPMAMFGLGPELDLNLDSTKHGLAQLAAGDFDGDGRTDLAGFYVTDDLTLYVATYSVDPQTLAISLSATIELTKVTGYQEIPLTQLAVGQFTTATHDQLLAAYLFHQDGRDTAKVAVIDFDANDANPLQPKVVSTWDSGDYGSSNGGEQVVLRMKAARFDWSGSVDRVAWMSSPPGGGTRLSVLQIDPVSYAITRPGDTRIQPDPRWHGMDVAVGNFDKKKQSALDPTQRERDPDLQIGVMGRDMNTHDNFLNVYSVDPQTFQITQESGVLLGGDYIQSRVLQPELVSRFWLIPSDLQGRSYRLGTVSKYTISDHMQPNVITAMPPMHVDFITPSEATSPTVLNLSGVPDAFWTKYEIAVENKSDSSTTSTYAQNFGFQEQVTGGYEVGDIKKTGVKVEDTVTASQDFKNSNEQNHGSFQARNDSVATTTTWSDAVAYTSSTVNVWSYEVLGRTVCPADKTDGSGNCADSDKRPLTIQFSAPGGSVDGIGSGTGIEWYQPPWEPGNIFSYPANYAQLQKIVDGDLDQLTTDKLYNTDNTPVTESTQWRSGVSSSSTLGNVRTFSGSNDLSVAGKASFVLGSYSGKFSFTAYGSDAFSSLTQNVSSTNESTGITLSKPNAFADYNEYKYAFTPYIFGTKQPDSFVDGSILDGLKTDVTTFGALRSAFVVDPKTMSPGGWWSQAYTLPDVALNHPARWSINTQATPSSSDVKPNCLVYGVSMNCAVREQSDPNDMWASDFHKMRGFFISSASKPGAGPQREYAVEGEKLTLEARVYNYSTTSMPANSTVHVRFYGVPWATNNNNTPIGDAFLIGEDVLSPIQAFDPTQDNLNWVLASTTWDTSDLGDKDFTFFVVTWLQNADGSLGTEMSGHGLNAVPGPVQSFAGAVNFEEILNGQSESYSNNIGFYNAVFHVLSQSDADAVAVQRSEVGDIRLGQIKVSDHKIDRGQRVEVSALLRTRGKSVSGVAVTFYDGDPTQGGKAFDLERVPHVRARDAYQVRVPFRSSDCGDHQIFVTVGRGKPYEVTDSSRPIKVQCAEPPQCTTNCFRSPEYYLNNLWGGLPKGEVWISGVEAPVSTRNIYALSQALKGGNSAVKTFNREYVAAQLSMLASSAVGQQRRAMLNSTLSCYGWSAADVVLSNGATIGAATSLREFLGQAEWAARAGRRPDWEKLSAILDHLNPDDPAGGCGANSGVAPTGPMTSLPESKRLDQKSGQQSSGNR